MPGSLTCGTSSSPQTNSREWHQRICVLGHTEDPGCALRGPGTPGAWTFSRDPCGAAGNIGEPQEGFSVEQSPGGLWAEVRVLELDVNMKTWMGGGYVLRWGGLWGLDGAA